MFLTVKFQVKNNNTTRSLDFWQPMTALGEQTQRYEYTLWAKKLHPF